MYIFIINPMSGDGKASIAWKELKNLLMEQQIPYKFLSSISETETKEFIAMELKQTKIKAIAIIGGDGTISSVIQQLTDTNIPIAIFPAGSGNDSAKMFKLTNNPQMFIANLLKGSTRPVDLFSIKDHYGITIAGTGIDSTIGNRVNHSFYKPILNKLKLGPLSYIIAALVSVLSFKPFNGNLTVDGEVHKLKKAWLVACGNTSSYGGGLNICPQALPTDGLLNITLLHNTSRMNVLFRLFPAIFLGGLVLKQGVSYIEGKKIIIETDRPIPVMVDGEIVTSTPFDITVQKNVLQLILTT